MRFGAKLPNSGAPAVDEGVPAMAQVLESAGFDSLWVSDHIVLPRKMRSRYPFAADGVANWPSDTPYLDALVALALAAAVTDRVTLGTAVLVLPLRNPVEVAKQCASIDVASGGRLRLGVGAGWLREEFVALGVPFGGRGARLEEWIAIVRDCWTGEPQARSSPHYELPADVLCLPVPAQRVPVLVGGHSPAARRRATTIGDGWLAQQSAGELDAAQLTPGADGVPERVVLRIVDSLHREAEVAARLRELESSGVDEIIVDVPVDRDGAARALDVLRGGVR